MAPKKPVMVIIVSVFISGLCTGNALSRSRINSFPDFRLCHHSFLQNGLQHHCDCNHCVARANGIMSSTVRAITAAIQ